MTLDDRLKRAVDSLGDKFRDDIARELQSLSGEWAAKGRADGATIRLADSMRAIDNAVSLSEILDALAAAVSNESARTGVFLLRGETLRSFRLFGFPSRYDDAPIEAPLSGASVLSDAIAQQTVATSAIGPFDELPEGVHATAIPIVLAGSPVGVVYVEGAEVATVEVLTRFAARALEAQTAIKTARAIAGADDLPTDVPETTPDNEDDAARRYARLLISEIKLYHGPAVAEGRREGDLSSRLGGEIARARAAYEQRVPPHVRGAADHFHAELVRTLAGGDASLLAKEDTR